MKLKVDETGVDKMGVDQQKKYGVYLMIFGDNSKIIFVKSS